MTTKKKKNGGITFKSLRHKTDTLNEDNATYALKRFIYSDV